MTTPALSGAEISTFKIISMELAMECALVAALFSVVGVPIMLMVYIFFPLSSSSCEDHVALAEQHGALAARMSRQIDAALAEHRATLQQEIDAMKGAISETVSDMRGQVRNLRADMREMQHSLLALDERVPRLESEQRPADHRAAEAADVPALPTAVSSGTSQVHHVTLESRRASANTVTPAETVAQRTIRRDDPLHAAQAGPRAAALGQSWGSSHDPHVRVDATPTPVSGMTRGSAARTRREAQGSQSAAPALPQSFPPSAGVWVGRFYEEAGGTVTRAPAPSADSEAPVARRNYRATSAAEVSSSWTRRFSSERSFQILAGAPAGASLSLATTPNYASPALMIKRVIFIDRQRKFQRKHRKLTMS